MDLHEGSNLNDAIKKAQTDYLFWQREVYERCMLTAAPGAEKSSNKGKGKARSAPQKGWGKVRKGQKTKAFSLHRNVSSPIKKHTWPSTWAQADPKGKPFCRNHILNGMCSGGCGRSHQCPVVKKDNSTCMGNHAPDNCPNK